MARWSRRTAALAIAAGVVIGGGSALSAGTDSPAAIRCGARPLPACPVPGVSLLISRVNGRVLYRLPHRRVRRLTRALLVPVGTSVDATRGRFRLTGATGDPSAPLATSDFYGGAARLTQGRTNTAIQLGLTGGSFASCGGEASAPHAQASRRRPPRRMWGSGHGRFQTRGRQAAAAVRGTIWLTEDDCNGTLVSVRRGVVQVTDFTNGRVVDVPAGHSYFADATPGSQRAFNFTVNCPPNGAPLGTTAHIDGVFTPSSEGEPLSITYTRPSGTSFTHMVQIDLYGNYSDQVVADELGTWNVSVQGIDAMQRRNPASCSFEAFK